MCHIPVVLISDEELREEVKIRFQNALSQILRFVALAPKIFAITLWAGHHKQVFTVAENTKNRSYNDKKLRQLSALNAIIFLIRF